MSEQARSDHDQQTFAAQPPDDVGSSEATPSEPTSPELAPAGAVPSEAEPTPPESAGSDSAEAAPSAPEPSDTGSEDSESAAAASETESAGSDAPDVVPSESTNSLSDFLDTLDERARTWWAARKERRAQKPGPTAASSSPPEEVEHPQTGPAGLPKPPPPEQRPEGQLFTGAVPVIQAQPEPQDSPEPQDDFEPQQGTAPQTQSPTAADAQATPEASADDTVILPAYRDDDAELSSTEDTETAPSSSAALGPPRQRRALDEQRRRDVIAQKARAIETETAAYYGAQPRESADDEEDLYTYIPPYNLPSRDPEPEPTRWDLYRRIFVSVGALAALISTVWMFGWLGGDPNAAAILSGNGLQETYADGWFSGEYALLSPDHNVYWLWPLIVVGLIIHAAFQWTDSQRSTPRQRRSGWLVGSASMLMLGVTAALHAGMLTWVLVTSVLIALMLVNAVRQFNLYTSRTTVERRLNDGVIGLFFGFALVQAMSSVSVWLTSSGWEVPGFPALLWAAAGLFICVWTAAFYSMTERGRITIALGLGWGMFWLIFPRLLAEVTSVWVAIGAAMGAFIVILSTQSRRHWINHAERRAAMGRPLEDII